ncbi:MAG: PIN domain-containing protein [Verrucomicrobia bacterium]|nr:PIN domain-containing protein [Verrucomicrobiota bacterium]
MTFLLDTNVISETWKPRPHPGVRAWLEARGAECGIPAPVMAEIADGIHAQSGIRREVLLARLNVFLGEWSGQLVPWDTAAAIEWGKQQHSVAVKRQPQPLWDSILEAMTLSRGLVLVTRNTEDFRRASTLNPWLE